MKLITSSEDTYYYHVLIIIIKYLTLIKHNSRIIDTVANRIYKIIIIFVFISLSIMINYPTAVNNKYILSNDQRIMLFNY